MENKEVKRTSKKKIALIVVLCLIVYALPVLAFIGFAYYCEDELKYVVEEDGTVNIGKDNIIISNDVTGEYDEYYTYYISGKLKASGDYDELEIKYKVYDEEKNILGYAVAYVEHVEKDESWKFKATYNAIDASEVKSYAFDSIDYY